MAKTNITRQVGESEADFQRRYKREYMRRYYAEKLAHPRPPKPTKSKAPTKQRGADLKPRKNSPFTQEEWDALRIQPGESEASWLARNAAARHAKYASRHPERLKDRSRAWYSSHPEERGPRRRIYRDANPEKVKAASSLYYHANKPARLALSKAWRTNNPERARARAKAWYAKNPGLNAFYSSKWRKAVVQATPMWANLDVILAIYQECARISEETGILHHVDHHYPLRGRRVSGLHVPENLNVIPATDNVRKHNTHPEDM